MDAITYSIFQEMTSEGWFILACGVLPIVLAMVLPEMLMSCNKFRARRGYIRFVLLWAKQKEIPKSKLRNIYYGAREELQYLYLKTLRFAPDKKNFGKITDSHVLVDKICSLYQN